MARHRIIYENGIVESTPDPHTAPEPKVGYGGRTQITHYWCLTPGRKLDRLIGEVRRAVSELPANEQEFIYQHYYRGKPLRAIARQTGRAVHKLEVLHRRALRILRVRLQPIVREYWDTGESEPDTDCPICNSYFLPEIDSLINNRDPTETWRHTLRVLHKEYGLRVSTPQVLIAHVRYHI